MDEDRRNAWEAAIAKRKRGKAVPNDALLALFRKDMFKGDDKVAIYEEANLFLECTFDWYWLEPVPWQGESVAKYWFKIRDWDRKLVRNWAEFALRKYIDKNDFDHWTALNMICARLHRERQPFPDILADWAAERHEGKRKRPPKEKGDHGRPPYTYEFRYITYVSADRCLRSFGMDKAEDRIGVIADWSGVDESVVSKGLTRLRDKNWRRAPLPEMPG